MIEEIGPTGEFIEADRWLVRADKSAVQGIILPLWQTWRMALCDDTHPARQEGAVWLLTELASDLPTIHASIFDGLCAPLL